MNRIRDGQTVLFTGDSITDCGRAREVVNPNDLNGLGRGYVMMTAAQLLADRPAAGLNFLNRGIGGECVVDLYARIQADLIDLGPDVVSILIGVNDSWRGFSGGKGVSLVQYEQIYRELLTKARTTLPAVRFVLCEPFVLPCGKVTGPLRADLDQRRAVVGRLSREFAAVFVPFQTRLDGATKQAPPEYWAYDGVHPTPAGHALMARTWLQAVEEQ